MAEKRVRLQPVVDQRVCDRLDKLAKTLGWSRNEVAERLLEVGTSGDEWIANKLGAMLRAGVNKALGVTPSAGKASEGGL